MTPRSPRLAPVWVLLGVTLAGVLLMAFWLTQAAADTMPPRPEPTATSNPGAPPVATPNPGAPPAATPGPGPAPDHAEHRTGALIWLKLSPANGPALWPTIWPGLWTVVQWQDTGGGWHDVTGWEGRPDDPAQKVWWVDPKDYSTGPFRWVVYDSARQTPLATSAAFHLPSGDNELMEVPAGVPVNRP